MNAEVTFLLTHVRNFYEKNSNLVPNHLLNSVFFEATVANETLRNLCFGTFKPRISNQKDLHVKQDKNMVFILCFEVKS